MPLEDRYPTPEGFDLPKPLVFPDVHDFTELLTVDGAWDFATMNHRNGMAQPATPEAITRPGWDLVVTRFCATSNMPRPHLVVTPTKMLLDAIYADQSESLAFAFFDRVSFRALYHEHNDRVLIVAGASGILADRWLAYVPLGTIPEV